MGKASRKKKERKIEEAKAEATTKPLKGKKNKKKLPKAKKLKPTKPLKKKIKATILNIAASKAEEKEPVTNIDSEKFANFKKEVRIIFKGGAYIVTAMTFAIAIIISIELHSHNRVLAGTKAGDINLSYVEYNQAKEDLQKGIKDYFQAPITFTLNGKTQQVTLEELGVRPLVEQTMEEIPVINFEKTNPLELLISVFQEHNIVPHYTLDGDKVIKTLENKFEIADQRARNARLVFIESNLEVENEKSGQAIDREELLASLKERIDNMATTGVALHIVKEDPRITAEALTKEKDRLIGLLEKSIKLHWENDSLNIKLIDHLEAIDFTEKATVSLSNEQANLPIVLGESQVKQQEESQIAIGGNVQIDIDTDKISEFLEENLLNDIEIPTSPANIYLNEEKKVIIEGKGEDGRAVSREKLVAAMELAVNNGLSEVPIPVNVEQAPLTISDDLKELGIKELISTGHSAYYGSPANRMFNIEFGTAKYNGLLIPAGEEFSFNDLLGPVDATSGFKPEKVIKQDKLEYEYGGGICQVSTTFYRAVLIAGLPITERKPHSWKVSYYAQSMGDGLDATIYPGVADFKFINDTPSTILIQSYTEGAEAYFKIYGTADGRAVTLDGPFGGGLTYRWNRTISVNGEDQTEEIWSRYKPIPPPEPVEKPKPVEPAPTTSRSGVDFNF